MRKLGSVVFFLFLLIVSAYAQKIVPEDISYSAISKQLEDALLSKAEKNIPYAQSSNAAINNYLETLKKEPDNYTANYGLAIALYADFQQPKSIIYFEKALRNEKDTTIETRFFLANSYHLVGKYDNAINYYNQYLALLTAHPAFFPDAQMKNAKANVQHRILMCENGKQIASANKPLLKNLEDKKITVTMIGDSINTLYDDFGAVFSANDTMLFYTSRRVDEGDIYCSHFNNNSWKKTKSIDKSINTDSYEAVINASPDGKRIYFFRSGIEDGTVYYSDYKNDHWNVPLPQLTITEQNTVFKNTRIYSFALAPSKNELFIVSDRIGGLGGKDIYVTKRINDTADWGALENLGPLVNSKYDEVALSLSKDGNTLYFSSNSDKSIGGFDVFVTSRSANRWTEAENLGAPINTPADDLFFHFLNSGQRASYSSAYHPGDGRTDLNLYYMDFCDDVKENTIKGLTAGFTSGTIKVTDSYTKKQVTTCNIADRKYTLTLPVGKSYIFEIETKGIAPVYTEFIVPFPDECKRYDIFQEITLDKPGDTLKLKSALLNNAYENKTPDISAYSVLLDKEDKTKLKSYKEIKLPTHVPAVITTSVYDSTGNLISKVNVGNEVFNTGNLKQAYDNKIGNTVATKSITNFSFPNTGFDFDKSKIKEEYKAELDKAVKFLTEVKPDSKIEINGYTDSKGNKKHNLVLSKQRAKAVANYLISKKISRDRIEIAGHGEANPLEPNTNNDGTDNPQGRAKNRRTEIIIK